MARWLPRIVLAVVGIVFAASLAYLLANSRGRGTGRQPGQAAIAPGAAHSADPLVPDELAAGLAITPFTLTTADGRTITRESLLGHITIVDFFFTRCIFVCPMLTAQMVDQCKALRNTDVRFLSVSVDAEHETDDSLRAYAIEHVPSDSEPGKWVFARGDKETIGAMVTGGLKFDVGEDPSREIKIEGGRTMKNIIHPPWFALIGANGEVLGVYRATDEDEMRALTQRARAAAEKLKK